MKKMICMLALAAASALTVWSIGRPPDVRFEKVLIDEGASETAAFADINGDRKLDIVSGEFWYEAPKWRPHRFRELDYISGYIDTFADLATAETTSSLGRGGSKPRGTRGTANGNGIPISISGSSHASSTPSM